MIWRRWARWCLSISQAADRNLLVEIAARLGYAARGAVYLSVGLMAVLAAVRLTPHADGAMGALTAWSRWPIGVLLLWVLGVGLCGFAVWRALQSVIDLERLGWGPAALVTRAGKAVSGLLYGSLGVTVLQLLDTLRDLRKDDRQASAVATMQSALDLPFGHKLVIGLGATLVAVGIGNIVRAGFDHFTADLQSGPEWDAPIGLLARVGYFARGVAFLPAGCFTIAAGRQAQAHEAVRIGYSLDWFSTLPYGHGILAIQGAGLMAFGLFGLVKAGFRRLWRPRHPRERPSK